ncbi:hypothetical protein PG988_001752 [Apiospora saccharicola]
MISRDDDINFKLLLYKEFEGAWRAPNPLLPCPVCSVLPSRTIDSPTTRQEARIFYELLRRSIAVTSTDGLLRGDNNGDNNVICANYGQNGLFLATCLGVIWARQAPLMAWQPDAPIPYFISYPIVMGGHEGLVATWLAA